MRKAFVIAAAVVAPVLSLVPVSAAVAKPGSHGAQTVAVYGDAPYGTSNTDTAEFQATPAFIDSVNADPQVGSVVHVGDIHSGKQFCTEAYDRSVAQLWTRYQDPLVYTPGDNEWSDCHKVAEGGGLFDPVSQQINYVPGPVPGTFADFAKGDPIANLDLVRSTFFPVPGRALGGGKMKVTSQAKAFDRAFPSDAKYVENVIWKKQDTLFVTINLPGGSNNDTDVWYGAPTASAAQKQEVTERSSADLRWLDYAFGEANEEHASSVVIITQADMWDLEKGPAHLDQYEPFVASIALHTTQFAKPVLLFNGDSHLYRSDNPLSPSPSAPCVTEPASGGAAAPCASSVWTAHPHYDVPNFHRVVVHGSTFPLEWLKLTIDDSANNPNGASAFGPFSWQRMIQP
jgi:hypothetical protein